MRVDACSDVTLPIVMVRGPVSYCAVTGWARATPSKVTSSGLTVTLTRRLGLRSVKGTGRETGALDSYTSVEGWVCMRVYRVG